MATQKRKDPNEPRRLSSGKYDKSDSRYYKWIGGRGGKETVKNQPKDYFSDIAKIRHGSTDTGVPAPAEAKSDKPRRNRKAA